ncbi:unnamed protein product [Leptidea sinapis]|uniref:Uncharacterized protein n=1 Tax=Leptidea sinapis TaxID=189913 RepID=A0A5E4Q5J5_9NEOP|nr:unnamed protein product [Leptidea sinapis]
MTSLPLTSSMKVAKLLNERHEESMLRRRELSERFPQRTYRAPDQRDGAHTGLLSDRDDTEYYVARDSHVEPYRRAEVPYNRHGDVDDRFGESTLPSIRDEFNGRRDKMTLPPRGLFDDV